MEASLQPRTDQPPVRNRFAYNASIIAYLLSYGTTIVPVFFVNIYYDTITNELNNNWDSITRKNNLSKLNLCYNLGGLTGIIVALAVSKLNPRLILNISRFIIAVCCLCLAVPHLTTMAVSRFFSNLFATVSQITIIWTVYELYLVNDQAKIMVAVSLSTPLFNFLLSLSAKLDTGDKWYWKQVLSFMPLGLLLGIVIDIFCTAGLNSVSYMLRRHGPETATEELRKIFSEDHTEELVRKFELQLKNEKKEKEKLEKRGVSQWAMDLMVYKSSMINLLIISFLATTGFQIQYMSNGLLIGSKVLSDTDATQRTKTLLTAETLIEVMIYLAAIVFNLTKKRKSSLMFSLFFGCMVLFTSSLGYLAQNLRIVRFGFLFLAASFPFYSPSVHLYTNDLIPPSLVPLQSICLLSVNTAADTLFPLVFNFENSSYESIGLKFGFLVICGFVSLGLIYWLMIETEGMSRDQVRRRLKNRWKKKKNEDIDLGEFVELKDEEILETDTENRLQ